MKYYSPKHLCILHQLIIQSSDYEIDGNFLVSLNHYYKPFNQINDENAIPDLYKTFFNNVDELIINCCYIIKKNHSDIINEIIEDLTRLFIESGSNNNSLIILKKIANGLDIYDIETWIKKDYSIPNDVKESIIKLYFMALGSDSIINNEEIQKLIYCPTFMRCTNLAEFIQDRIEYLQSDINNMGGYESFEKYIEVLCETLNKYDLFDKNRILNEILSIIAIDGVENMEKVFFNKLATSFGLTNYEIDELIFSYNS